MGISPRSRTKTDSHRNGPARPRTEIASIRRGEIITAAVDVITSQGIDKLSLSKIEQQAGMSRGQLTYYFRTKEQILLAVFDRLLQLMYQRMGDTCGEPATEPGGWEMTRHLLEAVLTHPAASPEFHSLQYTFLSQIPHRDDFRQRLAGLYEEWRGHMALGLERDRWPKGKAVPAREMASLVQAVLHGLAIQLVADPHAFDRGEMLQLCLDLLGNNLGIDRDHTAKSKRPTGRGRSKKSG